MLKAIFKKTEKTPVAEKTYSTAIVKLESVGNPDFGQYAPLSPLQIKPASTYQDAVNACKSYIRQFCLGGGNWSGGMIYHPVDGLIAYVSYNGKVWQVKSKEEIGCKDKQEIIALNQQII